MARHPVCVAGDPAEAPRAGGSFEIGTRDEVASRLGTVRELVSRSLAGFAAAGLIARTGRCVRLLDPTRLPSLADR